MPGKSAGNLPAGLTSFIGRRPELTLLRKVISEQRLVTLIGPGGVGKTRLALQLAHDARRSFADGVWFADLAAVSRGDLVGRTLSEVFGLRDESPDPTARVAANLSDKHLLLVLDNCEHVVDACAAVVGSIVAQAPSVRIIATSREVLGVPGEQVVAVPPLSIPDTDDPGAVARSDAVAMFIDRAELAVPGFALDETNRALVSKLCRQLDGIPLALELAAVRLRTIPLAEITTRLDDALHVLDRGNRAGPARQQTLQAAIDWSYQLCSPEEQALWQRLSVFAGGFTIRAAEAVCTAEGAAIPGVIASLSGLVDKSIVSKGHALARPTDRYRILEVLRQYGAAKLAESGHDEAVRRAHAQYYRRLARRGDRDFISARDAEWFAAVREEMANLRAAMAFSLSESSQLQDTAGVVSAMRHYWSHTAGSARDGYSWLTRLLEQYREPTRERVGALSAAALIASVLGESASAAERLKEARALTRRSVTDGLAGELILDQAMLARLDGDVDHAVVLAEQAAEMSLAEGDLPTAAGALLAGGVLALELDDDDRSLKLCKMLLDETRNAGAQLMRANALWLAALLSRRSGDLDGAREQLRESLDLFRLFPQSVLTAMAVGVAACVAVDAGECKRAAQLLGAAHRMWTVSHTPLPWVVGERITATAQAQALQVLGESNYLRAYQDGANMPETLALLRAIGDETPVSESEAPTDSSELTARQQEVARLVAEGASNKAIAERLFITQRTAEAHVANILAKLGFRSRSQVAAWVSRESAIGK